MSPSYFHPLQISKTLLSTIEFVAHVGFLKCFSTCYMLLLFFSLSAGFPRHQWLDIKEKVLASWLDREVYRYLQNDLVLIKATGSMRKSSTRMARCWLVCQFVHRGRLSNKKGWEGFYKRSKDCCHTKWSFWVWLLWPNLFLLDKTSTPIFTAVEEQACSIILLF